jgi:hypothetical protein
MARPRATTDARVTRVTRRRASIVRWWLSGNKTSIGEGVMNSIPDRESWRTGKAIIPPAASRAEPLFWIVLVAVSAAMIAGTIIGVANGILPSETFFVGP